MNEDFKHIRQQVEQEDGAVFPAKSFTSLVLEPAFNNAKAELLGPMMEVNRAHLIMLYEQGLITAQEARDIAGALTQLDLDGLAKSNYTGQCEDLFFQVEANLLELAGDAAGSLHLARSRNDMGVTMYRMALRRRLQKVMDALALLLEKFAALAEEHKDTVMVAITHTQQAQVSTIGHYLLGACQVLRRDYKRLLSAYQNVNHSSMGACAITTTGFNINRQRMAELLGFDDYILNSYDAIGGGDYLGEAASALHLAAIDAGRIVQDFMLWAGQEFGVLKAGDPYVQISSIMPQKRNPVSIEHLRSLLSAVSGQSNTVLQMLHNTPYGDIVDTEDDAQPYLWNACDLLEKCYTLWGNVMVTASFNKEIMMERAKNGFAVITELADTLARESNMSFRKAHTIATKVARGLSAQGRSLQSLTKEELDGFCQGVIGNPCPVAYEKIKESLDPVHFIQVRNIPGGCGPKAMEEMIGQEKLANRKIMEMNHAHKEKEEEAIAKQFKYVQSILSK